MMTILLSVCEGDHVVTEDGQSGIVVRIGDRMAQLEIARFPLNDRRGPGLIIISDVNKHVLTLSGCQILAVFFGENYFKTTVTPSVPRARQCQYVSLMVVLWKL